jgi:predicted ferric reductase
MNEIEGQEERPISFLRDVFMTVGIAAAGGVAGYFALPLFVPNLLNSMNGEGPKAFWYLSRGSALIAFVLLWVSMLMGVLITSRLSQLWPGGPAAFDLHQYLSLLGLAFAGMHGVLLLGDSYMNYSLVQILLPFSSAQYKPIWVGLGQAGFYVWAVLVGSYYVRRKIGGATWRWLHFASFVCYLGALLHGLVSGTDSSSPPLQVFYWVSGAVLLFFIVYRILAAVFKPQTAPKKAL